MKKSRYTTIYKGQKYECDAYSKSEARGIFKRMTAEPIGRNEMFGINYRLRSRLDSKVRLVKNANE
jgi:hypothetical protein